MKPSVKYEVVYCRQKQYSISEMCRFFNISRSGYYDYMKRREQPAKDLELSNGTSGYIYPFSQITITWDENRDYLWPIPASERVLTGGKLTQNPGWTDSTNFN